MGPGRRGGGPAQRVTELVTHYGPLLTLWFGVVTVVITRSRSRPCLLRVSTPASRKSAQ